MKKILALLIAMIFAATTPVMASGIALSDADMDEIAAGDYEIINLGTEEDPDEKLEAVWYSNNDISIDDNAQMNIQAVSNANSVDSADVVQTNISSADTTEPTNQLTIEGKNTASMKNFNPSLEMSTKHTEKTHNTWSKSNDFDLEESATWMASGEWNKSKHHEEDFVETLFEDEDLVVLTALASVGETEDKKGESEFAIAAAAGLVYDYDLDYTKTKDKDEWHTLGGTFSKKKTEEVVLTEDFTFDKTVWKEHTKETFKRKNFSENNHIDLEDTSQTAIQAVSNLNSVGSASGIQTNLASNVGVAGSIAHSNIITHASNGL